MYRRYLAVYDRVVRFPTRGAEGGEGCGEGGERRGAMGPTGREVAFDVVGHPPDFRYAAVLPFHRAPGGGEVTLVREWCQGPNRWMFGLPTGCFDAARHASLEACARAELSEEAALRGGTWHALLPPGHTGLPEIKWGLNCMHPFLAIDPERDPSPGPRDAEEELLRAERVSLARLQELVLSGEMLMPSVSAAIHALQRLRQLGLLEGAAPVGLL